MADDKLYEAIEDPSTKKVVVFGSGSFGTAMATLVARNGFKVVVLTRRQEVADSINKDHRNPTHLTSYDLPKNLTSSTNSVEALDGVDFIVHCIPVQQSKGFLEGFAHLIPAGVPVVSTSKGLHTDTLQTMNEIIPEALGRAQPTCYLSGPTFAEELMKCFPAGATLASANHSLAKQAACLFKAPFFRVYTTTDVVGVEVGGALKNVYAIMAGAAEGMGLGLNSAVLLTTLACREMNQMARALGAQPATLSGLAGMGDLMLTCMGGASRNRTVGTRLGKGETIDAILEDRRKGLAGVAEGVATAPAAVKLADKYNVRAPMIRAFAGVLQGHSTAEDALKALMTYPTHSDLVVEDDQDHH